VRKRLIWPVYGTCLIRYTHCAASAAASSVRGQQRRQEGKERSVARAPRGRRYCLFGSTGSTLIHSAGKTENESCDRAQPGQSPHLFHSNYIHTGTSILTYMVQTVLLPSWVLCSYCLHLCGICTLTDFRSFTPCHRLSFLSFSFLLLCTTSSHTGTHLCSSFRRFILAIRSNGTCSCGSLVTLFT
jgi:hypothetical protein